LLTHKKLTTLLPEKDLKVYLDGRKTDLLLKSEVEQKRNAQLQIEPKFVKVVKVFDGEVDSQRKSLWEAGVGSLSQNVPRTNILSPFREHKELVDLPIVTEKDFEGSQRKMEVTESQDVSDISEKREGEVIPKIVKKLKLWEVNEESFRAPEISVMSPPFQSPNPRPKSVQNPIIDQKINCSKPNTITKSDMKKNMAKSRTFKEIAKLKESQIFIDDSDSEEISESNREFPLKPSDEFSKEKRKSIEISDSEVESTAKQKELESIKNSAKLVKKKSQKLSFRDIGNAVGKVKVAGNTSIKRDSDISESGSEEDIPETYQFTQKPEKMDFQESRDLETYQKFQEPRKVQDIKPIEKVNGFKRPLSTKSSIAASIGAGLSSSLRISTPSKSTSTPIRGKFQTTNPPLNSTPLNSTPLPEFLQNAKNVREVFVAYQNHISDKRKSVSENIEVLKKEFRKWANLQEKECLEIVENCKAIPGYIENAKKFKRDETFMESPCKSFIFAKNDVKNGTEDPAVHEVTNPVAIRDEKIVGFREEPEDTTHQESVNMADATNTSINIYDYEPTQAVRDIYDYEPTPKQSQTFKPPVKPSNEDLEITNPNKLTFTEITLVEWVPEEVVLTISETKYETISTKSNLGYKNAEIVEYTPKSNLCIKPIESIEYVPDQIFEIIPVKFVEFVPELNLCFFKNESFGFVPVNEDRGIQCSISELCEEVKEKGDGCSSNLRADSEESVSKIENGKGVENVEISGGNEVSVRINLGDEEISQKEEGFANTSTAIHLVISDDDVQHSEAMEKSKVYFGNMDLSQPGSFRFQNTLDDESSISNCSELQMLASVNSDKELGDFKSQDLAKSQDYFDDIDMDLGDFETQKLAQNDSQSFVSTKNSQTQRLKRSQSPRNGSKKGSQSRLSSKNSQRIGSQRKVSQLFDFMESQILHPSQNKNSQKNDDFDFEIEESYCGFESQKPERFQRKEESQGFEKSQIYSTEIAPSTKPSNSRSIVSKTTSCSNIDTLGTSPAFEVSQINNTDVFPISKTPVKDNAATRWQTSIGKIGLESVASEIEESVIFDTLQSPNTIKPAPKGLIF
jgi:hypothetical protein